MNFLFWMGASFWTFFYAESRATMLSAILLLLSWPSGPVVQIQEVPSKSDCHSSQSPGHSQACGIYLLDSCGSLLTTVRIPHVLLLVIASHLPVILPLDSHTHTLQVSSASNIDWSVAVLLRIFRVSDPDWDCWGFQLHCVSSYVFSASLVHAAIGVLLISYCINQSSRS